MAVRVQVPERAALVRFLLHPWGRAVLILFIFLNTIGLATFTYYYVKYARLVDKKLATGLYANTSMVFAAPEVIMLGDEVHLEEIAAQLRKTGYGQGRTSRMGWYNLRPDAIEIFPGVDSYFNDEAAVIKVAHGKVTQIISLRDNAQRTQYALEPRLITNLFDQSRQKRRLVRFDELPKHLVNAVVSIEDKRFFKHSGFDPLRILKAAYVDLKSGEHAEGASTLSMQVARMFWLTPEKTWRRKAAETIITLHLEQKFTKEQIFEFYANEVDLGRRGSFAIRGFGEAAQAYFGKDVRQLTLAEAATLAGIIQRPSYFNPVRWPERARLRRNVVLSLMRENGYIDDREYAQAASSPLVVARSGTDTTDAPYFVDLVSDYLQEQFAEHDFRTNSYRIYSTLDLDLQRDAVEAVRLGMREVDEQLRRRSRKGQPLPEAQVALVALDPQTGEVRALVGGRDYGQSQLNRAEAKRQPGSAFKPFVYAAALNTALTGGTTVITPATVLVDEPTTFFYEDRTYTPSNFRQQFYGVVTVRQALAKSLNIPTVKLAEQVGYRAVVDLARRAGLDIDRRPMPSVALGAYETTPLEIAGAYTMFANNGVAAKPLMVRLIRTQSGQTIFEAKPERQPVLDPRVNFLVVDMMQEVLRSGTGAGVRSRGFTLPAAGKTGTSHDGWFAGFTSKLVCIVWVGFDDNRELGLEGAKSALPIWTEFMKRAHQHRLYRNPREFEIPEGIVSVDIDPSSGQLATSACPLIRAEYFIVGSQPTQACSVHGGGALQVASWEAVTPAVPKESNGRAVPARPRAQVESHAPLAGVTPSPAPAVKPKEEKKGFFGRIRDIFR